MVSLHRQVLRPGRKVSENCSWYIRETKLIFNKKNFEEYLDSIIRNRLIKSWMKVEQIWSSYKDPFSGIQQEFEASGTWETSHKKRTTRG